MNLFYIRFFLLACQKQERDGATKHLANLEAKMKRVQ